jgi:pSer/pThr/pTyr-binding forkhead associated (FHA) protein
MPTPVLTILKFCLVALIYLFLARVLRAVWVEITTDRAPSPSPANNASAAASTTHAPATAATSGRKARRAPTTPTLKVLEPIEQLGTLHPMVEEMTIGRAPGCAIVIIDSFASQLHARVFHRDGAWFVEDLGSTNGTWVNRSRVHGPAKLHVGDRLKVGDTVMEVMP